MSDTTKTKQSRRPLTLEQAIRQAVREVQETQGVSLPRLAQAAGVSPDSLSRFMRGRAMVRIDGASRLCRTLGLELQAGRRCTCLGRGHDEAVAR